MRAPQTHEKQSLRLWLNIFDCARTVEKQVQNRFRQEFGTTLPRFDVLAALERANQPLTMGELSDRLLASNGNVTGIVHRLAQDGYITRTKSDQDGRSHIVALSSKGRSYFAELAKAHERWIDETFKGLSDDQINAILMPLAHLRASMASGEPE